MYLDKEEMKFAVLYAVKQYKAPISMSLTYEIFTWDKEIMEYFDLSQALAELIEGGYIQQKYYRNEEAYDLTDSGRSACLYFTERVPKSIRTRIDEAIGRLRYDELVDPDAVRTDVVFAAEEQYMAKLSIFQDKTPMLDLSLNVGKRHLAERVAAYLKDNSQKIYEEILKLCTEEDN